MNRSMLLACASLLIEGRAARASSEGRLALAGELNDLAANILADNLLECAASCETLAIASDYLFAAAYRFGLAGQDAKAEAYEMLGEELNEYQLDRDRHATAV